LTYLPESAKRVERDDDDVAHPLDAPNSVSEALGRDARVEASIREEPAAATVVLGVVLLGG
jgi:hypothetical protein